MHQTKKRSEWQFGMKAHVGVDAHSALVHPVVGTAANVSDVTQTRAFVHGGKREVFGDAGYQCVQKHEDTQDDARVVWYIATRPGKRRGLNKDMAPGQLLD
jgi:IS5 family transposase